jgi:RNA polymerase subunit RPABC4/transcription elongation factor Spt4
MHVRVCPECDEEYRPDIATCADCGADLVDRAVDEQGRRVAEPAVAEGEPITLVGLYSGPAAALRPLAEALAAAGVAQRFVPIPGQSGLTLAVAQEDGVRAMEALAAFHGRGTELGLSELAATFEAGAEEHEHACPACGAAIPADASECPDCGLEWGGGEPPPPPPDEPITG